MTSTATKYEVLGLGAPFLDHVIRVTDDYLRTLPGQKGGMEIVDYQTLERLLKDSNGSSSLSTGGSAANTLKGLSQLGHSCALTGKIGTDGAGEQFLAMLNEWNIRSLMIPTPTPTGQLACLVTPEGERTFRDFLGSGVEMGPQDLKAEFFKGVKLVHIEGYTLLNEGLTLKAMELAKEAGAKISFDLASFELSKNYKKSILDHLNHHVDILFANKDEVHSLTGHFPEGGCDFLRDLCEVVVVSMGKEGCWVGTRQEQSRCFAYPIENPLDTTGAGDLFAAGFLHGYLLGKTPSECARLGALVSKEVVQVLGAEIPKETWKRLQQEIEA